MPLESNFHDLKRQKFSVSSCLFTYNFHSKHNSTGPCSIKEQQKSPQKAYPRTHVKCTESPLTFPIHIIDHIIDMSSFCIDLGCCSLISTPWQWCPTYSCPVTREHYSRDNDQEDKSCPRSWGGIWSHRSWWTHDMRKKTTRTTIKKSCLVLS